MLGCHDFCGYYEWTFHHIRQTFGQRGVHEFWAGAIAADSQQAYADAAMRARLRGLLEVWTKTGQDEHCDWSFTLDEQKNALRWDMRQCPSKGFLIESDLNADEDYCDHCMGWIVPLLQRAGAEVAGHQHNHRGQCWGEMRIKGVPYTPLELADDIRNDPRWQHGYLHTFADGQATGEDDCAAIHRAFSGCDRVRLGYELMTDQQWLGAPTGQCPRGVVLGDDQPTLRQVAANWIDLVERSRPLLLHAYLPQGSNIDFGSLGIPRPAPILPVLIRADIYRHQPHAPPPSTEAQSQLLAQAIIVLRAKITAEGQT
jgi:hypothetical protein